MHATTKWRWATVAAFVAGAFALAGCQQPKGVAGAGGELAPVSNREATLHDLAAELGMVVAHTSRASATLRSPANTLVLYPDPAGCVYLNGTALPDSSGVEAAGGTFLIPASLTSRIVPLLRIVEPPRTVIDVEPAPEPPRPEQAVGRVVIDPGHGGKDPGALSCLGFCEKDVTLAVGRLVAAELRRNRVEVVLTRQTDRFIELEDRPAVANRSKADLFVSIHADAAKNRHAKGFTVYVSRTPSGASRAAAQAILGRLCASCSPSRGMRNGDFRVLVHARCPAVLVELGYLTNRVEAARLNDESYRQRIATAVARGVHDYLRRR